MRILVMLLAIGLIICGTSAEADVYSWTDENGVKRFSNKAPEGDIKKLQTTEEILYDEEAAALRRTAEKEQEEMRLKEEERQQRENMQNHYMQDRLLLEKRLRETENQVENLEQELGKSGDSDQRSYSYYPYRPVRPCWPNCGDKPGKPRPPRPPYDRPPGINPPQAKPPVYPEPYQMRAKEASKSGRDQHSYKTSRPARSAPIASPVIR